MTNNDKVRRLGEAIHGPRWQNAVARDLGVNPRQVHRWVSGQHKPRDSVISDLLAVARDRHEQIAEAIKECVA